MAEYYKLTEAVRASYEQRAGRMGGMLPSTLSLESILVWRDTCLPEYRIVEDYFCIRIWDRIRKKQYYYMPLGGYEKTSFKRLVDALYEECAQAAPLFFMDVREEELVWYKELDGYRCKISSEESDSDYIYSREAMEAAFERAGERYNKRYFIRKYNPCRRKLETGDENICRAIVERAFCEFHACQMCSNGCLKDTISNFLELSDSRNIRGILVMADGLAVGYAAGLIQGDSFVFLFKKNCHGYRGLDEYLQTELLKELPDTVKWINYTEDMGMEGLRNYKRRLAPYYLKPKYRVLVERTGWR